MEHSQQSYALLQYVADHHDVSLLDFINTDLKGESFPKTYTEKQGLLFRLADLGLVSISGHQHDGPATRRLRLTGAGFDLLFRTKEVTPLQEIAESLKKQVAELQKQTAETQKQVEEAQKQNAAFVSQISVLKEQVNALRSLNDLLKKEGDQRTKADKYYFVLGAIVSLLSALIVEHGAALLAALQGLAQ